MHLSGGEPAVQVAPDPLQDAGAATIGVEPLRSRPSCSA